MPLQTVVAEADVAPLRAEDATGGFCILPGHVLAALSIALQALPCLPASFPSEMRKRRAPGSVGNDG